MAMFADKLVLITGAGRGIGRAAALGFAEQWAAMISTDIDRPLVVGEGGFIYAPLLAPSEPFKAGSGGP